MLDAELIRRVRAWQATDPDPETRAELDALVAVGDEDGLRDRFDRRLEFGTAGLRAEMGAGPNRMNRVVVRRAATGLMRYLGDGRKVVVGYDARRKSDEFALETARVVAAAGGVAVLFPRPVPTPLVAFAVRLLGADAGVMCTASHNPPADNGFKVYLDDGAQIVPPVDRQIAAAIDEIAEGDGGGAPALLEVPGGDGAEDSRGIRQAGSDVVDAYVERAVSRLGAGPRQLSIVYTPLHGVGLDVTERVFAAAGFEPLHVVAAQAVPDPAFPTTPYPNPEEDGVLDLAYGQAEALGADLVLAHDPDADRLGVAVRGRDGLWRRLTGDQVGALLADYRLRRSNGGPGERLVVDTFVSSGLVARLAAAHGVHHVETLTGFKWLMRPVIAHPEWELVLAYEEALGYAVDGYLRDKDGIAAALAFAELAAELRAAGLTVWDRLEQLARRHGLFATATWSFRFTGYAARSRIDALMAALRSSPPARLGHHEVRRVEDLLAGGRLPPVDAVVLHLGGDARLIARPSGTEPKLKVYGRVCRAVGDTPSSLARAEADAARELESLHGAVSSYVDRTAHG
ncbi:phospho-sugar mutase [Rhabdothermincola sediminis]|uniref:phospho-sugar mutase n=1 Tax=Rhabdothermincola sediminis TaxID=2751370 RepID=UPI001AA0A5A9|nr:phospho-sugar mutase [Rhabdothermincola sediminis]